MCLFFAFVPPIYNIYLSFSSVSASPNFDLFFLKVFIFETLPAVLRASLWLCIQRSILQGLWGTYMIWGLNLSYIQDKNSTSTSSPNLCLYDFITFIFHICSASLLCSFKSVSQKNVIRWEYFILSSKLSCFLSNTEDNCFMCFSKFSSY